MSDLIHELHTVVFKYDEFSSFPLAARAGGRLMTCLSLINWSFIYYGIFFNTFILFSRQSDTNHLLSFCFYFKLSFFISYVNHIFILFSNILFVCLQLLWKKRWGKYLMNSLLSLIQWVHFILADVFVRFVSI